MGVIIGDPQREKYVEKMQNNKKMEGSRMGVVSSWVIEQQGSESLPLTSPPYYPRVPLVVRVLFVFNREALK